MSDREDAGVRTIWVLAPCEKVWQHASCAILESETILVGS